MLIEMGFISEVFIYTKLLAPEKAGPLPEFGSACKRNYK
jgi:hypothetical protein